MYRSMIFHWMESQCNIEQWKYLLITLFVLRHEDGTVRFWDASGVSLKPLYKLATANIFQTDADHTENFPQCGEEEWPPFRKVTSPISTADISEACGEMGCKDNCWPTYLLAPLMCSGIKTKPIWIAYIGQQYKYWKYLACQATSADLSAKQENISELMCAK